MFAFKFCTKAQCYFDKIFYNIATEKDFITDICNVSKYVNTLLEIPQGRTKEEIRQREKIIKDFYASWNAVNPGKRIYNTNLQEFIYIKFLSIQETAEKAARSYKSIAVRLRNKTVVY